MTLPGFILIASIGAALALLCYVALFEWTRYRRRVGK